VIAHSDGEIECWGQPKLESWEYPLRDPAEPHHDFTGVARDKLPIQAIAAQVVLMDDSSGRWEIHTFGLG
jgi:hypothetical protein